MDARDARPVQSRALHELELILVNRGQMAGTASKSLSRAAFSSNV